MAQARYMAMTGDPMQALVIGIDRNFLYRILNKNSDGMRWTKQQYEISAKGKAWPDSRRTNQ